MPIRQPIDLSRTTLAILAGGQGSRMKLSKAWLRLGRRPILDWLLERMQWRGPTMLVSAPAVAHPPGSALFDREVVDPVDGLGPLRGLLTALEHLSTPTMAVITVDMPAVGPAVLAWLVGALTARPTCHGVMCHLKPGAIQRIEPFPSAFRSEASGLVAQRLAAGRRSVQDLCADSSFLALGAPPEWPAATWTNLNTPGDLAAFEAAQANRMKGKKR